MLRRLVMRSSRPVDLFLLAVALTFGACSPGSPAPAPTSGLTDAPVASQRGPKTIRIAIAREPDGFVISLTPNATTSGAAFQVQSIAANKLEGTDDKGRQFGELAQALPTISDGTWVINPDGSMETTWKLRPNIKWHDGAPVTADDLVFGYQAVTTPGVISLGGQYLRNIREVVALDDLTAVVRWSRIYVDADKPRDNLPLLPRHVLERELAKGGETFLGARYWTQGFIGNGPFRLANWVTGEQVQFEAFDDYYRGRPKVDRIIVRVIADANTQVANALAGEIDVTLPPGIDVDVALSVRERWQGTQNQVLLASPGQLRNLFPQQREDTVRPRALLDPRVKQALYRSLDRAAVSEVMSRGLSPLADSMVPPFYEIRKDLEAAIPQYPFDLEAAARTFQEAGWTRDAEGAMRNAQGEQFRFEIRGLAPTSTERELNASIVGWKQLGLQVDQLIRPAAAGPDTAERIMYPGLEYVGGSYDDLFGERLSCASIISPSSQYRGRNSAGWCNQEAETYINRLQTTIAPDERLDLMRGMVRVVMTDMAVFPIYWSLDPILAVGVKNLPQPSAPTRVHTYNIYEWDKV